MEYLGYTDDSWERSRERPRFESLLAVVDEPRDEPIGIAVSDLSRLFRSRRDRDRIDTRLADGRTHVLSAREDLCTEDPDGADRYRQIADLLMLSYEGEWPGLTAGASRTEIADHFVDHALGPWIGAWGASGAPLTAAVEDVRNRLHWLLARWDDPARLEPLFAPFLEVVDQHEPYELPARIRALALVGVRNSALEDLHVDGVIAQSDWRLLTQAAAHALATVDSAPASEPARPEDPFAGVVEANPTASAAFRVLCPLRPGEAREWSPPDVDRPPLPAADGPARLDTDGYEIRHAMDSYVSTRLAGSLTDLIAAGGVFAPPSLKHVSRNPHKLFAIVDAFLAHGGTIVTANVKLSPTEIVRRDEIASYNSTDMTWAGVASYDVREHVNVGRNDPCPCGSGRKFKRCCGA